MMLRFILLIYNLGHEYSWSIVRAVRSDMTLLPTLITSDFVDNDDNNGKVPIGSQYDSEQEGDPLNEYEEYVKVEYYSNEDGDIVYIRVG